jgi:mycothiol synthase
MGYTNVRTHYVMAAKLDEPVPPPDWPAGLGVRPFVPGQDDRALFEAGEEAFQDLWNRPPSTFERWLAPTHEPGFDPSLWFLGVDQASGEIVAVCLCALVAGRGEVDVVGVRRPWRKQGLGLALLRHALGEFQRRGLDEVGLNVDSASPTGAPRLYGRAGFHVTKRVFRFEKVVREA